MTTQKSKVKNYLKNEPKFRERKNKYKGLVNLLILDHPFLASIIEHYDNDARGKERVIDLFIKFMTMNRWWNKLLEDNPELRGMDYNDKKLLQQQAQISLGYEGGYKQNIKKLKTL